jgi:hypothetical protein
VRELGEIRQRGRPKINQMLALQIATRAFAGDRRDAGGESNR